MLAPSQVLTLTIFFKDKKHLFSFLRKSNPQLSKDSRTNVRSETDLQFHPQKSSSSPIISSSLAAGIKETSNSFSSLPPQLAGGSLGSAQQREPKQIPSV